MSKKTSKFLFHLTIAIVLTLGLSLSFQSLLAAWQAPTANPPDDNVAGPIFNSGTVANPLIRQPLIIDNRATFSDLAIFNSDLIVQDWSIYQSSGDFNVWSDFLGKNCLSINDFGDISMVNNLAVAGNITSGGKNVCLADGTNCSSGASIWALNGTSAYYNGGKVGIGTDSPQFILDVQTNSVVDEVVRISSNRETTFQIDSANNTSILNPLIKSRRSRGTLAAPSPVQNNNSVFEIWGEGYNQNNRFEVAGGISIVADGNPSGDSVPGKIVFATTEPGTSYLAGTAPTRRMTIKSNGNVGIGTDNPEATLQMVSNNVAENTEFIIDGYNNDPDSGPNIVTRRAKGTSVSSAANVAIGDDLGGMVYSGWYSNGWREGGFIDVLVDGTPKVAGIPTSFNFATSNGTDSPEYRLTIDADGKVGIGTTDPIANLHIISNEKPDDDSSFVISGYDKDQSHGPNLTSYRARGTSAAPLPVINGDDLGGLSYSGWYSGAWREAGYIDFLVDGNPTVNGIPMAINFAISDGSGEPDYKLTIQSDGNVGIGIDDPQALLHVNSGDLAVNYTGPGYSLSGDLTVASDNVDLTLIGKDDSSFSSLIKFSEIAHNSNNAVDIWTLGRNTYSYGGTQTNHGGFWLSYAPASANFWQDQYKVLFVDTSGKVGIGTADPYRKLHVKATNAILRMDSDQESEGGSQIKLTEVDGTTIVDTWAIGRFSNLTGEGGDGSLRIYYGAGDNYFADASQALMFIIKKNGNIGIGTDNPGADKLDVRGRAYASGGWQATNADYAEWFEKEGRVNPGDIIGINLKTGKARKYQAGDRFIGIYSTNPAVIGNRTMETDQELQKDHVLVGLLGQLEFNKEQVVIENGIVKTKDNKEIGTLLSNGKVLIGVGK